MFGALSALFSGLALVGVIIAVWLQTQELEAQRKEFHRSAEAQQTTAKLQAISALLFSCENHLMEIRARSREEVATGVVFPRAGFEATTYEHVRAEYLHWIHKTLREEVGITLPFPEKAEG